MELEKDRSFDALIQFVLPKVKREFVDVIQHLRPPKFPYDIDLALAAKGKALFYSKRVACHRCHGVYDGRGNVTWPGAHPDVGTDRSRRGLVTDQFVRVFDDSPLRKDGRVVPSEGYAATPLTGVWANLNLNRDSITSVSSWGDEHSTRTA